MANEPNSPPDSPGDAPGSSDNLDVIRKLLQKLEEAASVDDSGAERSTAPTRPSQGQVREALPGLPTDNAVNVKAGEAPYRELGLQERRPIVTSQEHASTQEQQAPLSDRTKTPLMGTIAFALGAVSAAAVAIYFEPLKRIYPSGAEQPAQMAAAPDPAVTGTRDTSQTAMTKASPSAGQSGPPASSASTAPVTTATVKTGPVTTGPVTTGPVTTGPASQATSAAPPAAAPTVSLVKLLEGPSGRSMPFPLRLDPMPRESDAQLLMLRNVPEWLTLSKGSALGNEIWLMPAHAASDLHYFVAEGAEGAAAIKVELFTMDGRLIARADSLVMASRSPSDRQPGHPPIQQPGQQYASAPLSQLPSIPEQPTRLAADAVVRLLARADLLLDTGDLSAARDLFRMAAEQGSAGGAMKLAETYDAGELERLGMTSSLADAMAARRWYELAQSLGALQAGDRLTALNQR